MITWASLRAGARTAVPCNWTCGGQGHSCPINALSSSVGCRYSATEGLLRKSMTSSYVSFPALPQASSSRSACTRSHGLGFFFPWAAPMVPSQPLGLLGSSAGRLQYAWSSKLEISILGRALQKIRKKKNSNIERTSMRTR